jgi:hypothetical protein
MDDAKLEIALAKVYNRQPSAGYGYSYVIGILCDDYLDRSGALLGRVRDLSIKLGKENQIESIKKAIIKLEAELRELES